MNQELFLLVLNIAVVVLFTIAYIPQLITTYNTKDNSGVSSMFWMLIAISTTLTLRNVLVTGDAAWYIYMGQIINASIATFIFFWLLETYQGNKYHSLIAFLVYGILLLFLLNFFGHDGIQVAATITIILAYLDQITHFVRTKRAEGTTPLLYLIFALGLTLLVCIFVITNVSIFVIITECTNIVLLLTCAFLSNKYK